MNPSKFRWNRRTLLHAAAGSALSGRKYVQGAEASTGMNVFGPTPGYSPQIGTLVSEMIWMRDIVLRTVKGLNQEQLDFLLDSKANRIGALLLHLAATDKLYHLNTFEKISPERLGGNPDFKDWRIAMNLGEPARQAIKGHDLGYYLGRLKETRDTTLAAFRKHDDAWLMAVDRTWEWGPTNNLCKWFHVCEHESHHLGQITMILGRAPGGKVDGRG